MCVAVRLSVLAGVLALVATGCARDTVTTLDIATTTSVQNSGLLDVLLPAYRKEANVDVRVHAAGSGRALQMLAEGLAQLVISHAPEAEARAMQEHPDWSQRRLAHNWFVVVGPPADPAGIKDARDVVDAFMRIARADVAFVSRGDQSGTHEREMGIWEAAGVKPSGERYIVSGRGMALALRHTDEVRGYTLSDEATFLQLSPQIELEILFRNDSRLLNVYSVIHPPGDEAAARFGDWLTAGNGRALIAGYRVAGRQVFELDDRY